jgi:hypothetical protein
MVTLDVFKADGFNSITLTDWINRTPFVPGRMGKLGIFEEMGITTTSVQIEEYTGSLSLIANTSRSAPPNQHAHNKRKIRNLVVPHFPVEDAILAAEIQNVRAFGSSSELQAIETELQRRLGEIRRKHDATLEYGRIGAVKGIIYDADGSTVIYNLFTEFGLAQDSTDFVLGTTTTDVRGKISAVLRNIETELGMDSYTTVRAVCGDTFWDELIKHPDVKTAYDYANERGFFQEDNRFKGFYFNGIWFENYRGKVGSVGFIPASEAYAFPVGVPGLFKTAFAPANFVEAVNTPGLPVYAKQELMKYGRGIDLYTESNPLSYCTRPKVLQKLTTSN